MTNLYNYLMLLDCVNVMFSNNTLYSYGGYNGFAVFFKKINLGHDSEEIMINDFNIKQLYIYQGNELHYFKADKNNRTYNWAATKLIN